MNTDTKEPTQEDDLEVALNNVMRLGVYRGMLVSELIGGYSCLAKKFKTKKELDTFLDEIEKAWSDKIKLQDSIVKD